MPKIEEIYTKIFSELVRFAGVPPKVKLKTIELTKERQETQFPRLKSVMRSAPEVLPLHGRSFITRFTCENNVYLAINLNNLAKHEKEIVSDHFLELGICEYEIEECFFLYLRYHLEGIYHLKPEFSSKEFADNVLSICEFPDYAGHDISDLISYHADIAVYEISKNSIYTKSSLWSIASNLTASSATLRAPHIDDGLALKLNKIQMDSPQLSENIYTALTSLHWKYTFFEMYKCIEALFFLPFGLRAKTALKLNTALDAHLLISEVTKNFKEKEKDSIIALFELIDQNIISSISNRNIKSFKELEASPTHINIATRIYKIRNQLVHQADYEDRTPLDLKNENWPALIELLIELISYLYSSHQLEITRSSKTH